MNNLLDLYVGHLHFIECVGLFLQSVSQPSGKLLFTHPDLGHLLVPQGDAHLDTLGQCASAAVRELLVLECGSAATGA